MKPAADPRTADEAAVDLDDEAMLDRVQRQAYAFFVEHTDPATGLVCDSTQPESPCSTTVVGLALSCLPIAVERGWTSRAAAAAQALATLRFFEAADMSGAPGSTGWRGFYFHFLDMKSGRRTWASELSSIDTAFLAAGMHVAALYFDRDDTVEKDIRAVAAALCDRIDWRWMQDGEGAVRHGWTPERGFLPYRWQGYSEALLLYALALGADRHPASASAYAEWASTYRWRSIYGHEHLYAGPLFIHQYSHQWIDLRGIADAFMRERGSDYFENSRHATTIQHEYGQRNPRRFRHYHGRSWGWTASDGPGPKTVNVAGRRRRLYGYRARGAPFGPDDGTIAPWASIASLPFAPEVVLPTLRHLVAANSDPDNGASFRCSFNPSLPGGKGDMGWISPWHFGLNDGPIVVMIENHRSGLLWSLMRRCGPIARGLERAGFRGGWLEQPEAAR